MTDLPDPLVPPEVDLRGIPFPVMEMAKAFSSHFGGSVQETAELFRQICRIEGMRTDEDPIQ